MKAFDDAFVTSVATIMASTLHKENDWINEQRAAYYQHWLEYHPAFLNT
jgi:hypothetical protein